MTFVLKVAKIRLTLTANLRKPPNVSSFATRYSEEEMSNRKLIRPSLADIKDQLTVRQPRNNNKRPSANEQTNAENFYYVKQMQNKTPMVVVLQDGETIHGVIEWYDKNCIRLNRNPEPSLLVLKHYIKYMYKENEDKESES